MTKKILLVDDEPDVTYTIKNILEDNGYNVDSFNDPILALNYYKINFYDLVILDIKMPIMDGFELYTKIREKDSQVKVCFLTAITRINEDYFIQKPVEMEDLLKKLISIMNI